MNPTYDFSGQVALVTGAASGMGLAAAEAYAKAGASVAMLDNRADVLVEAAKSLSDKGFTVLPITCNVLEATEVEAAVAKTVETYGRLDMAFNNAGIQSDVADLAETSVEAFDHMTGINLRGVFLAMKYELAQMKKQGSGAIVNNSSLGGFVGVPGRSTYHAAKHGVHGLTKTAGLEYAAQGIRVNAVAPGIINTPMVAEMMERENAVDGMMRDVPIDRLGTAEEVANAVMWLSSPGASFVVGHVIAVDGGYVAR
ncbi:SDR family NAD(P)-dependent oxidoreductase [Novosphingobium mangrovi (ex Hu et al. 2023)]|uniref:SDR family oxidoreductase n=1 Tax=Novosphingobium mangrovi (ex Hu et al. 2023) TaxID=2930094 RepID=A0ABT0A7Z6_9SPHN|nr:SDR family oxidoreductase [Novosphingobium mangrovi (ex Hu et al. 2023)]MCJ1959306.1 SDR family oxidoreductase [Novosphingobium mangrovi (ex Hu et al. 2023)]